MKRVAALGLAFLAVLPFLGACNRDKVRAGEARLDPNGIVEVAQPGKGYKPITETVTIHDGDRVRVLSGDARLLLPDAELGLRDNSEIVVGKEPELLKGDLLVVPEQQLKVKSAGSDFGIVGAARITRTYSVTAKSYQGLISVRSAGSVLAVNALRQATVATLGTEVPRSAVPLQYVEKDPWDRRFLAEAIDVGRTLQERSDGATRQFTDDGKTAGFYRILLPELESEPEFKQTLLDPARPTGEHLVGANLAVVGRQGPFSQRWHRIFSFRSEGASWGLVALDQGVVKQPDLVTRLDAALERGGTPGNPRQVAFTPRGTTSTTQPTSTTPTTRPTPTTQPPTNPGPTDPGDDDPDPPAPPIAGIVPVPELDELPIDPGASESPIPIIDTLTGLVPGLVPELGL